jgi:hypothetical protein
MWGRIRALAMGSVRFSIKGIFWHVPDSLERLKKKLFTAIMSKKWLNLQK